MTPEEYAKANEKRTLRLHFGCEIHQTDAHTIEISYYPGPEPFTEDFMQSVEKTMGVNRGRALLEELALEAAKRGIMDQITVR